MGVYHCRATRRDLLLGPREGVVSRGQVQGLEERKLTVVGLENDPELNPAAAEALLRLVVNVARARGVAAESDDNDERKAA